MQSPLVKEPVERPALSLERQSIESREYKKRQSLHLGLDAASRQDRSPAVSLLLSARWTLDYHARRIAWERFNNDQASNTLSRPERSPA